MKIWFLLLSILSAPTVFADTQIYGTISSGISSSQSRFADGTRTHSSQIEDYGSYIGIRGRIPLGNGAAHTIWQWEQTTPTDTSLRNQWRAKKENNDLRQHADFTEAR